jgi:membrane dipeptidase
MYIVDAHQDIAYNTFVYGRDYRTPVLTLREREGSTTPPATIALPDAILGRVALVFGTLFAAPKERWASPNGVAIYETPRQAHDAALRQLDYYRQLADEDERLRLVTTQADLDAVLATWADDKQTGEHQQGLVVLMEGADPIIEPEQFVEWYERGVRLVGTAWSETRYSGGTGAPGGLTALGRDLLDVMGRYNAILDFSHMAEQAFYEAIDQYQGVVIASHSNPRKFVDSDRHLSDEMIGLLAERDGVMGIVLYNRFLKQGWTKGDPKSDVPLSIVLDAIDHVCQLTGSARHVGIGSDFDGGFGADSIPQGLDTVSDLLAIADGLRERGYSDADIRLVMGENFTRQLRASLPTG